MAWRSSICSTILLLFCIFFELFDCLHSALLRCFPFSLLCHTLEPSFPSCVHFDSAFHCFCDVSATSSIFYTHKATLLQIELSRSNFAASCHCSYCLLHALSFHCEGLRSSPHASFLRLDANFCHLLFLPLRSLTSSYGSFFLSFNSILAQNLVFPFRTLALSTLHRFLLLCTLPTCKRQLVQMCFSLPVHPCPHSLRFGLSPFCLLLQIHFILFLPVATVPVSHLCLFSSDLAPYVSSLRCHFYFLALFHPILAVHLPASMSFSCDSVSCPSFLNFRAFGFLWEVLDSCVHAFFILPHSLLTSDSIPTSLLSFAAQTFAPAALTLRVSFFIHETVQRSRPLPPRVSLQPQVVSLCSCCSTLTFTVT